MEQIPAAARPGVQRQGDMDLLTRVTAAMFSYVFLLVLLGCATPLRIDHSAMYWNAALGIGLAAIMRLVLFLLRSRLYALGRGWMLTPLIVSMAFSSGAAGLLHLNILKVYGPGHWTYTYMLMWLLGIAAGSTISFTPNFSLLVLQLVLLFGPSLPWEFSSGTAHGITLGITTFAFCGFLLMQGHRLHGMYWDLLAERAAEIERTRQLEAAKAAAERAQEQLRYQATHDVLTGLLNRAEILRVCACETERARRLGTTLGILMIDLDHFKQVNDRFGHPGGDEVLRAVAARVTSNLRPYDALGRYGGEEFLVILPSCDAEQCGAAAERIRQAISSQPVELPSAPAQITASFGATVFDPTAANDLRPMIARADRALYEAKEKGRNRVAVQIPRALVCWPGSCESACRNGRPAPE